MLVMLAIAGAIVMFATGWVSSRALRPMGEFVRSVPSLASLPTRPGFEDVLDDLLELARIELGGLGIPQRDLDRIFERFYRVDRARSRATGGTGLGLSIVRHVATNHGGEVLVASTEGEGSTFVLRLPIGVTAIAADGDVGGASREGVV